MRVTLLVSIVLLFSCGPASPGGGSGGGAGGSGGGSAGSGGGAGGGAETCPSGANVLVPGTQLTFNSETSGANPQHDFCFVVPQGSSTIMLKLSGGSCAPFNCLGDDFEMYLKKGEVPNDYSPDASTKMWSYTPDPTAMGMYSKSASPGVWWFSWISEQNSLGFKGVKLTMTLP